VDYPVRYLIVREGVIENIATWDGVSYWTPPEGTTAELDLHGSHIGWIKQEDGSFAAPFVPEPEVIEGSSETLPE
jgi:hypothetical protein